VPILIKSPTERAITELFAAVSVNNKSLDPLLPVTVSAAAPVAAPASSHKTSNLR